MLRFLFDESHRKDEGLLLETNEAMSRFYEQMNAIAARSEHAKRPHKHSKLRHAHLNIWVTALKDALNELEQSKYCCIQYSSMYSSGTDLKSDAYRLHVYFYKSALVRIFSTLDKLGVFIDELFTLNTAKMKQRFSYFTVLRNMYKLKAEAPLEKELFQHKVLYQSAMSELRRKRNMEIHYVNAELLDDLESLSKDVVDPAEVEDIVLNIALLEQGYEMVLHSLHTVFIYANRWLK